MSAVKYLGIGEQIHNLDFNYGEFAIIKPAEFDGLGKVPPRTPSKSRGMDLQSKRRGAPFYIAGRSVPCFPNIEVKK